MKNDNPVILYLLMRNDMNSLNPGKAMAQAHHAGTQMAETVKDKLHNALYLQWLEQAGHFGTVLTLACDCYDLEEAMQGAKKLGLLHGTLLDPTYPIDDGQTTHTFPVVTCGYVLCRRDDSDFLSALPLHP